MRPVCTSLLLSAVLLAQGRTWVVDQGGGGQFLEIQPAVDAASPGDRIEVLGPYSYAAFTMSEGLDLQAIQGAACSGWAIRYLPVGQWARVGGFRVNGASLWYCAGSVLLDRIATTSPFGGTIDISQCGAVLVRDSVLVGQWSTGAFGLPGREALSVGNGNVVLQRCRLTGGAGAFANPYGTATPGGAGLYVLGGDVLLTECVVTGGGGGSGFGASPPAPGGTGIAASAADVLVFGACDVRGGANGFPMGGQAPAIYGDSGFPTAVRATSDCNFVGSLVSVTTLAPLPYLSTSGSAAIGGPAAMTLLGAPGTAAFLLFGVQHVHVPLGGLHGAVLLELTTAAPLFPLAIGASGTVPLTFSVPNDPTLRNQFAFFQAAALAPGAPLPSLTNLGDFRIQ